MKKIMIIILTALLLLPFTGCGKNNTPTKAVDKYLKSFQESPFNVTMWYKFDDNIREVVEDLVKGMEYRIIGEEDYSESNRNQKAVLVEITGYDIGKMFSTYYDNNVVEAVKIILRSYTKEQMYNIMQYERDKYAELLVEASTQYFRNLAEEVKAKGKTYTNKNAKFIAYYSTQEKEWLVATNKYLPEYIDYITGNMNSVILEYRDKLNTQQ